MTNYRKIYKEIYKKVDLEKVFKHYDIDFKTYYGARGKEYLICCPLPDHDDLTPSFSFNVETGVWHCFLCGGGDFFKFIKIMEGFKKTEHAIEITKQRLGITDKFEVDFKYLDESFETFTECRKEKNINDEENIEIKEIKLPESYLAEDYIDIVKKRVTLEIAKQWKMRYCHNPSSKWEKKYHGRLIIPIYYEGKLVTFAARDMIGRSEKWNKVKADIKAGKYSEKEKKKLVEKYECKKILYPFAAPIAYIFFNWDNAIKNREYVILVEGILDAIRLIEYGFNAMAILSCNLNDYRVTQIMRHFDTVYLALDNDDKINSKGKRVNPGQEAAKKIINEKLDDIEIYNIVLPLGKDPDECNKTEFQERMNLAKKEFKKNVYF